MDFVTNRHIGQNKRAIDLPSLKKEAKLPVILNRSELRQLFRAPKLLKHRIALTFIYSAGLRSQEASNMKISDIDIIVICNFRFNQVDSRYLQMSKTKRKHG